MTSTSAWTTVARSRGFPPDLEVSKVEKRDTRGLGNFSHSRGFSRGFSEGKIDEQFIKQLIDDLNPSFVSNIDIEQQHIFV